TINGRSDDDGCPDPGEGMVMLMADRIELLEPLRFRGASARLHKRSEALLGQVAATMRAHPELLRIRIAVHVHYTGDGDEERTAERAQAIKDMLVQLGIEPERLDAKGYGSSRPLVPDDQREARELNERVELIILEKRVKR